MSTLKKKNKSTKQENVIEIEIEVAPDTFITETIPASCGNYLMLTDVCTELLEFGREGRIPYIVYIYLLRCRNRNNNKCFPSISTISKELNISEKTIKSSITFLYQKNFININSGYKGISNNYYFPKEWFYEYFEKDYKQIKAERRERALSDKRKTKKDKELEEKNEKITELEKEIAKLKQENLKLGRKKKNRTLKAKEIDDCDYDDLEEPEEEKEIF